MGVRARSMQTRRSSRSFRRRGAAVPLALLAIVALGSSALGAYWTPTATLASSPAADSIRTAAISASGPNIVAGWRDTVAGTQELWVRESNDSGGAWAAPVRLVGDPTYSARDLSLDSGSGAHWATWSEKRPIAGHPNQAVIFAATKPIGSGSWTDVVVSAAGDGTRSPTVAVTPARAFVIYQAKVGSTIHALIQNARTGSGTFGGVTDLGVAPKSKGAPGLDATATVAAAVWSDGHIRLKRGLIGVAPASAVAWQPTQDLGVGDSPIIVTGPSRFVLVYHHVGDVWVRVSGNAGQSFGPAARLLDGNPAEFNVYFADSAAVNGLKFVLSATAGGDAFGSGLRLTSTNGGTTWTTDDSNSAFADGRLVTFTTVGGVPKLAEMWLANLFSDTNKIVFHRQE